MRTKHIQSFIFAVIFAFESIAVGFVPAGAQTISENTVTEDVAAKNTVTKNVSEETVVENESALSEPVGNTEGNISWSIDTNGHLTIEGTGNYEDRANNLKGGWLEYATEIKTATVKVTGITNTSYMFYNCTNLVSVDLTGLDTSNVTTMCYMFYNCTKLTTLDLSKFVTENVLDMSYMFYGCSSLQSLDLTGFKTNIVTDMKYMFYCCYGLKSLDLSSFNTSNVKYMSYMFYDCYNLEKLKLNGDDSMLLFQTYLVEDMTAMFARCSKLETLNLTGFDTTKLDTENTENLGMIFLQCSNLTRLIVPSEFSKAIPVPQYGDPNNSYEWIYGPTGKPATEIKSAGTYIRSDVYGGTPVSYNGMDGDLYWEIDTNGHLLITGEGDYAPRSENSMTGWLTHSEEIITATVVVDGITKTNSMFQSCSNLTSVNLEKLYTSDVTDMHNMFESCKKLEEVDVSKFDTKNVTNMAYMFNGCFALKALDVSHFDTASVTNMESMFGGCKGLTELDITGFDTNKVTDMTCMFSECDALEILDISSFSTDQVTLYMTNMIAGCDSLIVVIAPEIPSTKNLFPPLEIFEWYNQQTGETVTQITNAGIYIRSDVYGKEVIIYKGTDVDLEWTIDTNGHLLITGEGDYAPRSENSKTGWLAYADKIKKATVKVEGIKNTGYMFCNCTNLVSVDLNGLETSSVESMTNMFMNCGKLTALTLNGLDTANVKDMSSMFGGCIGLKSLTLNEINTAGVENMSMMFFGCSGLTTLTLNGLDTGNVTNMMGMFFGCSNLKSLYINELNTASVTNMGSMFQGCGSLTSLDIKRFETGKVIYMRDMFSECNSLTTLEAPDHSSSSVEMKLPVTNHVWKYQPEGTAVTKVTKAGTYIREENLGEPVVETPKPTVKEEPKTKVETKVETKTDGTVTKTVKTTEPTGEVTLNIVSTSKNKKKETIVKMEYDASGQLQNADVEVAQVVKSSKMTVNLKELKALVNQVAIGNVNYIYPVGSGLFDAKNVELLGEYYKKQDVLGVAQKKANVSIKVSAKTSAGKNKYTVSMQKKDLTKKKFVVYASDKKGNAVMVNNKKNTAKVSKKNNLTIKVAKKGKYQLQNTSDAKKTDKKIMKTVKPKKTKATVKKGKSTSFQLSKKCNKDNISKITYSSNSSKVKVTKKGKIKAKGSGSAKVTATVTMKNGKKKKITMKVKVA